MEQRKLTLIGAGSAVFTRGLVTDLLNNDCGFKWHIALVDIDGPVLRSMAKLVKKMSAERGGAADVTYATDRREALPGSDYVVATVGVGGRRAWEADVYIPRKYGVMQPVGDTAMPGGVSRAMRMVPAMLDIADDVRKLCPEATFINYSNPMAVICKAVLKKAGKSMIGLCHGVPHTINTIAETAGLPAGECTAYWGGVNHCTFIYKFLHKGTDAWPVVLEAVKKINPENMRDPFALWFLEHYGAYLAPGDRHTSEFFTEYFPGGDYYGKILGKDAFSFENTISGGDNTHKNLMVAAESDGPLPEGFIRRAGGEHEQLMDIIHSIEYDENRIFSANAPNRGALPGIPADTVLDIPCAVGRYGFTPLDQPAFPAALAALTNRFAACFDLTVEAALSGSRDLFVQAVMTGGYLNDRNAAEKMTDELLSAHKSYLPY